MMTPISNTTQDSVNPYETTAVRSVDASVSSYIRFGISFRIAIVLTGGLFLAVLFTRNGFAEIFDNFGVELPGATQIALHPGTLVFVGSPFLLTFAKEFLDASLQQLVFRTPGSTPRRSGQACRHWRRETWLARGICNGPLLWISTLQHRFRWLRHTGSLSAACATR